MEEDLDETVVLSPEVQVLVERTDLTVEQAISVINVLERAEFRSGSDETTETQSPPGGWRLLRERRTTETQTPVGELISPGGRDEELSSGERTSPGRRSHEPSPGGQNLPGGTPCLSLA